MPRVFLDSEFTQFRDGQVLALGLAADDGRECYVEVLDPIRHARASVFCKDVVIPQFGRVPGAGVPDDVQAGRRVADWLETFADPIVVAYDYKLDWRFLEEVLRTAGRWPALAARLRADDVAGVAAPGSPGAAAQDAVFESSRIPGRHHALVDARALRAAWQAHAAATRV